ncbi:hypothetical protein M378DRAFT_530526 [Amanita muscaria Koide BX008]|uniref:Uncharacterized protein n=1 Tax=Amanita muscaria (strain Koide BX008) TaxID=946122 RepID=A0A0C2X9R5_AMAMK|nr:hypothetical protein M378DRAFT_530526 [Amanita muscaria Koide BX008]
MSSLKFDDELDLGSLSIHISDNKPVPASIHTGAYLLDCHFPVFTPDALPEAISYSPLSISLSSDTDPLVLARRDLFDARFQLISDGLDESNKLQFFDAPSDLVPGVYEGGLKTWECCLDLVDYLEATDYRSLSWANGYWLVAEQLFHQCTCCMGPCLHPPDQVSR